MTLVPVVVAPDEAQTVEAACLALQTLSAYAALTGTSKTAAVRELVVDLVADLMHLCAQSGFSFAAVTEEAALAVRHDAEPGF